MAALKWAREPRPQLGGPAAAVLRDLADRANDKAACWPSVATIAKATGYSKRTVQYALRRLEAENLIRTRYTGRGNLYLLAVPGVQELHPPVQELHPRGARPAPKALRSPLNQDALTRKPENHDPEPLEFVTLEQLKAYTATIGKTSPATGNI
jgi:DNA-binding transcriptional ArsR family regulator